jgi:non-ribosomal peptide synthetase component F
MARNVRYRPSRVTTPYRSAETSNGGMMHQVWRDVVVYDMWGTKLAVFRTGGSPATAWQSARRWLDRFYDTGVTAGEPFITTQAAILRWIKARRDLYAELDEDQRKKAETALRG